jgi:hypothetical protein
MDYSRGVLKAMNASFFPVVRRNLGPYLVEKMEFIKTIVDNSCTGGVHLVLRPGGCRNAAANAQVTTLAR